VTHARTRRSVSLCLALIHNFGSAIGAKVAGLLLGIFMRGWLSRTIVLTATVTATAASCLIGAVSFAVDVDVPWFVASAVCAPIILGGILLVPRVRQTLAPLAAS